MLVHHGLGARQGRRVRKAGRRSTPWCSPATPCCTATSSCFKEVPWAGVVLDEAQNIKNPETKQAQAARVAEGRLPHRPDRHAGREPRRRPVVDHGVPQPRLARHPGRVPAATSSSRSRPSTTPRPPSRLKRLTGPFILRRLKTDGRSSPTCPRSWR